MVGTTRFELATSPTPRVRSTRLSHVPTCYDCLSHLDEPEAGVPSVYTNSTGAEPKVCNPMRNWTLHRVTRLDARCCPCCLSLRRCDVFLGQLAAGAEEE